MTETGLDDHGLHRDDPGCMRVQSGRRLNPLRLRPEDVDINDIAHALSRQCRYNGHVTGFLSVARHSIWVSNRVWALGYPVEVAIQALLHDAAEAYLGDMIRPLKYGPVGQGYMEAERHIERTIADAFGLTYPFHPAVSEADGFVLLEVELPETHGERWLWNSTPDDDRQAFLDRLAFLRQFAD